MRVPWLGCRFGVYSSDVSSKAKVNKSFGVYNKRCRG
jgi:hypothetical protein